MKNDNDMQLTRACRNVAIYTGQTRVLIDYKSLYQIITAFVITNHYPGTHVFW